MLAERAGVLQGGLGRNEELLALHVVLGEEGVDLRPQDPAKATVLLDADEHAEADSSAQSDEDGSDGGLEDSATDPPDRQVGRGQGDEEEDEADHEPRGVEVADIVLHRQEECGGGIVTIKPIPTAGQASSAE